MKFATCNEPWRDEPIEEVFATAARIGYTGVEIAPFTLAETVDEISAARRKEIVKAAGDAGVEIVGLHWLLVSPKGLHITTADAALRQKTVDYMKKLVDFCGDLGGKVMVHGSPKQRDVEAGSTFDDAWKRARDVFAACGPTCAERDVMLTIEALSTKETNFINTATEAAKLAEEVGHPNIGIMLDLKAMSAMPEGIIENIKRFGAKAAHFHANEPCGKGVGMPLTSDEGKNVDLKPVLAELKASGFQGWVSVEPFDYNPDPTTVAEVGFKALTAAVS